jgi:hypothetical protein
VPEPGEFSPDGGRHDDEFAAFSAAEEIARGEDDRAGPDRVGDFPLDLLLENSCFAGQMTGFRNILIRSKSTLIAENVCELS